MCLLYQDNFAQSVQGSSFQDNTLKLVPYENSTLGIKTQYPETWIKHQSNNSVRFLSPQESALDNHTEQLKMSTYVPGSVPFFQSKETSLPLLAGNTISYLSQAKKDFKLLNSQPATVNGKSGHMIEYLYTSAAGQTKSLGFVIPYSGKVYFISYFAEPVKYPTLLPVILNIINSTDVGISNTGVSSGDSEGSNSNNVDNGKSNDDNNDGKNGKSNNDNNNDDQGDVCEENIPT